MSMRLLRPLLFLLVLATVAVSAQPPENPGGAAPSPTPAPSAAPPPSPPPLPAHPDAQPPQPSPATAAPSTPSPPPPADAAQPPPEEPTEVVVFLKDGQILTGILVQANAAKVVIRIGGIETTFPAANVDRYRVLPPLLVRYEEMRRAAGEDPEQVLKLAEWLRARERYELAHLEAERATRLDPNNVTARQLVALLAHQLELKRKSRESTAAAPAPGVPAGPPRLAPQPPKPRDFPLLTEAQVNLIKVYEINLAQNPRLVIRRETITRLMERYAGNPLIPVTQEARDGIYRKPEREILELMFRLQAREFYGDVKVVDQPESMRLFRDDVHRTWLLNSCATTACHGGEEAGRLQLFTRKPGSDQTVYTNFIILDRYRLADGTPLIDYDNPERSPLLQAALPREDSLFKHPPAGPLIPGTRIERDSFRPAFRSTDDRRFIQAVEWIRSMYRPHPNYPVEYRPPAPSVLPKPPDEANPAAAKPDPAPR